MFRPMMGRLAGSGFVHCGALLGHGFWLLAIVGGQVMIDRVCQSRMVVR